MKRAKLPLAAAVTFVLALLLCPRPPSSDRVDPTRLLQKALTSAASLGPGFRMWDCVVNGQRIVSKRTFDRDRLASPDPGMVGLLKRNYTPLVEGEDAIAGRAAWVLRLKPRIKHRPWRQLWIDRKGGGVLAMRDWDSRNRLKRAMRTIPIAPYGTESLTDAVPPPRSKLALLTNRAIPLPRYVPRGFELVQSRGLPDGGGLMVFSDGLFPITILIRFPHSRDREHTQRMRLHDWGQGLVLSVRRGDKELALVGDLPREELERMARSLL